MSVPLWVIEAAERFWAEAGGPEPFPRNLRRPIALSLPLAVVLLPGLRIAAIDHWLRRAGVGCAMNVPDRPLRACLIARYGQGLLFLDGQDGEDEQRFSLAHELAHYLRHYQGPRRAAAERLGLEILHVLDGERPPRHDERAHALLAGVRIGYHVHLMERTADGDAAGSATSTAEDEADQLAYELLAPSEMVLTATARFPAAARYERLLFLLRSTYGLPNGLSRRYAACLAQPPRRPDSFLQRLRAVP